MTTNPPTGNAFESHLAQFSQQIRAVLPEEACLRFVERIRAVHADWPGLDFADCADMARASMAGERKQVKAKLDDLDRKRRKAAEQMEKEQAYLDALQRIEPALPEVQRLAYRFPGCSSTAELLNRAGTTFAALGMVEEDGRVLDEMLAEAD
jgi:hypothetical protein